MIRSTFLVIVCAVVAVCAVYGALVSIKGRKGALAVVFGPIDRKPVNFATLQLKPSPNQYLVCPEGFCAAEAHVAAPSFSVPVDELQTAWFEVVAAQPSTTIIASDSAERQFDIETLTPLVGYPDTITVRFLELPEGRSTLAIYSRSHYGHSDVGANKKRIDRWLAEVTTLIDKND
jgi:uncharacterized protein (DUF1499 family)